MTKTISGTDRLIDYLRQNMLAKFCIQWPQFAKLIERYGEDEILATYAEKLAGRGYKAAQIKLAINKVTQNDLYYPKPHVFANMIKTPNFNEQAEEDKILTESERMNIARIIQEAVNNKSAREYHHKLGVSNFKNKEEYRAQIEKVAEKILGRPLSR